MSIAANQRATATKVAMVIPTGPNIKDRAGVADLLESIATYEAGLGPVVIINDRNDRQALSALLEENNIPGVVLEHPRAGIGNHWLGRLSHGLGHGYSWVREHHPDHHILRIDTDALIIGPFIDRLERLLKAAPELGMIGSGSPAAPGAGNWWVGRIYRMSRLVTRDETNGKIQFNLVGQRGKLRRFVRQAMSHGYAPGTGITGGAYLITAEANRRFGALSALRDDMVTTNDFLGEDSFWSIAIFAAGMRILNQENPGDIFGVCWKGLPGKSLDEVVARANPIIHSLKDHPPFTEETSREFFRKLRKLHDGALIER